jgi:hypothetical protein
MTKTTTQISILMAAMLAITGTAYASGASESTESPQRAGEMSTMTNGVPNLETTNSPYGDRINQGGRIANKQLTASETSDSPLRAGEMSTMTGGVPNVSTNNRVSNVSQASMTIVQTTALGAGSTHIPTIEVEAP